jgi:hypothetical protein
MPVGHRPPPLSSPDGCKARGDIRPCTARRTRSARRSSADLSSGPRKFTFNDELVEGGTGIGMQLNGIGHIGIDKACCNGNRAADFVTIEGVKTLGIEKVPPRVTRGVVLDTGAQVAGVSRRPGVQTPKRPEG